MADVILVLGGGLTKEGEIGGVSKRRVELAVQLWKDGRAPRILLSGRYSVWCDDTHVYPKQTEAEAMRVYALGLGVPADVLLKEGESKDTIGNIFFAKRDFLEKNDWKHVIIVTSDFHLARVKYLQDIVLGPSYDVEYALVPSDATPEDRVKREAQEAKTLEIFKLTIGDAIPGDTEDFERLLFTRHPGHAKDPEITFAKLKELLGRA